MTGRLPCVVLGSGNIGTDLTEKLLRSPVLELTAVVGIDPASEGLARARARGLDTSTDGAAWIAAHAAPGTLVFDATSAWAHREHASRLLEAGLRLVDLTPAQLGPGVVPVVNLADHGHAPDVNLISCGGQATVPMVAAVAAACPVPYAEIVATVASRSAGPGTRQNIDEFTQKTARAVAEIGGAARGKAIIVLNPAEPPILDAQHDLLRAARRRRPGRGHRQRPRHARPGRRLRARLSAAHRPDLRRGQAHPLRGGRGGGDWLPPYAGNLDIMTAAAVQVGEELARLRQAEAAGGQVRA